MHRKKITVDVTYVHTQRVGALSFAVKSPRFLDGRSSYRCYLNPYLGERYFLHQAFSRSPANITSRRYNEITHYT